jgi:predicted SAM-dependent methyltransferase
MNPFRKLYRSARKRVMRLVHPSETAKIRHRLAPFCRGYGVDLGFGGDPITANAIRVDLPLPYTKVGRFPVQLGGDCANLKWFRDGSLDFVYSSHLLEDFQDTRAVLREWLRVLTPGGHLVLFCPDEQRYRAYCARLGLNNNPHHVHEDFSLAKVKAYLAELGGSEVVHERDPVHIYSWELVCRRT